MRHVKIGEEGLGGACHVWGVDEECPCEAGFREGQVVDLMMEV